MSSNTKKSQSREGGWKRKAITRANENRQLRKNVTRISRDRDRYKKIAAKANPSAQQDDIQTVVPLQGKEQLVFLALQLFLTARIGYRAVSRVLQVLAPYLGLKKTPCPQTIINWVARLSIVKLQQLVPMPSAQRRLCGDPFSNGMIWMMDTSIGLGAGKILAILALDYRHHQTNDGAPTLRNVSCVGIAVAVSWTGIDIANFLQKIIAVMGRPAAFLKDGGKDLQKATEILNDRKFYSLNIADISHVIANLFKHEYGESPLLASFLTICGQASKNLKQSILACLAPPKVSVKSRFMNLHRLVAWAERVLKFSPVGRVAEDSIVAKLRKSLNQLPECRAFVVRFLRDAVPLLACQKILKVNGLSTQTYLECEALLAPLPTNSPIRLGFMQWAEEQREVAQRLELTDQGLPVCSDLIESLFGVGKRHGAGETKDAQQIAKRLAAECGEITPADARLVLDGVHYEFLDTLGGLIASTI